MNKSEYFYNIRDVFAWFKVYLRQKFLTKIYTIETVKYISCIVKIFTLFHIISTFIAANTVHVDVYHFFLFSFLSNSESVLRIKKSKCLLSSDIECLSLTTRPHWCIKVQVQL